MYLLKETGARRSEWTFSESNYLFNMYIVNITIIYNGRSNVSQQ
jgi:hypothetical protein